MLSWIVSLLTALVPPSSDDEVVYRWRVAVAVTVGGIILMQALFMAFAFGLFSFFGATGFVKGDDIAVLRQAQDKITQKIVVQLQSIAQNQQLNARESSRVAVIDATDKACHAQNDETKRLYTDMQQAALSRWYDATNGATFDVPRCDQLVTATHP